MLAVLHEDDNPIESLAHVDEVRRPVIENSQQAKPMSKLQRLLRGAPELRDDLEKLARQKNTLKALPKGRNFH